MDKWHSTELTTLTEVRKNGYDSCSVTSNNRDKSIRLLANIWSYFWKLLIFLMILAVINTILRSFLVEQTNLMFNSNKKNENALKDINYALSNDKIEPNMIWIASNLELDLNNEYLSKWIIKQGIVFETELDIDMMSNYEAQELTDIDVHNMDIYTQHIPFFLYMRIDDNMDILNMRIDDVINCLRYDDDIWQNSLIVIKAKSRSLVYGPRIANKKRGTTTQRSADFGELLT